MKKAWRTTKGKCATYSSLTFESHELFRLCSIATVIFFPLSAIALSRALRQRFSRIWPARGVTGIIADSSPSCAYQWRWIITRKRSAVRFPLLFKNHKPGRRQDASPACLSLSASKDISVLCAVKKDYLDSCNYSLRNVYGATYIYIFFF